MMSSAFRVVTFNMHGFNQAEVALSEILDCVKPSVILLQEQWLTCDNLFKLDKFANYLAVYSPASRLAVEVGPLYGRPSGGVAID